MPLRGGSFVLCALALGTTLAGCGGDLGPTATRTGNTSNTDGTSNTGSTTHAGAPTGTATPSPRTTSPVELCERLISHWARVVLDGGAGSQLDYQAMGLSGGQNDILRDVVAAGRSATATRGPAAARQVIDERTRHQCDERHRGGTPSGGPWR